MRDEQVGRPTHSLVWFVPVSLMVFFAVTLAGCARPEPVTTVNDLAARLQAEGIDYQSTGAIDLAAFRRAQIDEGLALHGDRLVVELLRIEDERTFKLFVTSGALLAGVERQTGQPLLDKPLMFVHRPFVVVVRQEPAPGQIKSALEKIFPKQDD